MIQTAAAPEPLPAQPGSLVLQMRETLFGNMALHRFPPPGCAAD